MPNKNRDKGHRYERYLAQKYRDAGYPDAATSRLMAPYLDALGVDLVGTAPWLVQAKATVRTPSYTKILDGMPDNEHTVRLVHHKPPRQSHTVTMYRKDWVEWIVEPYGIDVRAGSQKNPELVTIDEGWWMEIVEDHAN